MLGVRCWGLGVRGFGKCVVWDICFYSKIALILRTPESLDSSFMILKCPSSERFWTCGPAQISLEKR